MRIVFLAGDAEFDYRLDVDPEQNPTVADLVAALAGTDVDEALGLCIDGRFVPRTVPLALAGLRDGSACALASGPSHDEPERPSLAVTAGLGAGDTFALGGGSTTVGRDEANEIVLDSPTVSRRHARVEPRDGAVDVDDLGSRNGTSIDGAWVTDRSSVTPGSPVRLGAVELELALPSDDRPSFAFGPGTAAAHLTFNRPPRPAPPPEPEPLAVPAPPAEGSGGSPFSWAAVLAPLVVGGVLAMLFGPLMAAFALLSPVMLVASWWEQRRRHVRGRRSAVRRYAAELERFADDLDVAHRAARTRLRALLPDPAEVVRRATAPSTRLWERRRDHDDFLLLRAGTGDLPWPPPLAARGGDLPAEVAALVERRSVLDRCPVPISLRGGTVGVVGPRAVTVAVARSLVCQAAVHQGPADVMIAVVTTPDRLRDWSWVRWLPHHRDLAEGEDGWLVATTDDDVDRLTATMRTGTAVPVVIVDGDHLSSPRAAALRSALHDAGGIVVAETADRLPAVCRTVITLTGTEGSAVVAEPATGTAVGGVLVAGMTERTARRCARALARFADPELAVPGAGLPGHVGLLDLLGVDGSDPAAILRRWATGATAAPIGVWAGGALELDLVADGPHALIGGTTGSGKSELLRSMVVSLAATAAPDRLTFVLVDYKGGSAFDECARLPHVVGVVTDLDEHLGARALRCLEAELQHRERVLRAAGAADLRAYEAAGRPGGPLPRLAVVVDEFATLAAELPDFLGSLVGIAQRGRSLGVHLVLATQRPSGAINDDIRTNTNLRIALRVLDAADSTDVIGCADAAAIGRSQAGRALARLGPGEVVAFQTALVSAPSCPASERPALRLEPADVDLAKAGGAGDTGPTDLHHLVAMIDDAFARSGLDEPRRPWPEPLPDRVAASDAGRGAFAVADDPAHQRRLPVRWRTEDGNLLVYGLPGSGVSTALVGAVVALVAGAPADDVHVYGVDHGAGGLAPLAPLPHTGAVIDGSDRERQARLVRWLRGEVAARRAGGAAEPRIVLAIDNVGGLLATFDDVAGLETVEDLTRVYLDGPAAGVHVVIGADRVGGVPSALAAVTTQKLLLRLADVYDYATFGLRPAAVPATAGRGWWAEDGLEVQVAVPEVHAVGGRPAASRPPRPVRCLPVDVDAGALVTAVEVGGDRWYLPVGLGDRDIAPVGFPLYEGDHALISGPSRAGKSTALLAVAGAVRAAAPGTAIMAIASPRSPLRRAPGITLVDPGDVDTLAGAAPWLLLVDDADLVDDGAGALRRLLDAGAPGGRVVAAGRPDRLRAAYGHWTAVVRESRIGLALKPDPDLDGDLWRTPLPRRLTSRPAPGRGWLLGDGEVELVQVARPAATVDVAEPAA